MSLLKAVGEVARAAPSAIQDNLSKQRRNVGIPIDASPRDMARESPDQEISDIIEGRGRAVNQVTAQPAQGRKMERGQWIDQARNKDRW